MKTGTKSLLFGAHCMLVHPVMVAVAWARLYGFPLDPRVWLAFVLHDIGYWGKPNMDGKEGKTHVELGARIMHRLFDRWETKSANYASNWFKLHDFTRAEELDGWMVSDIQETAFGYMSVIYVRRKTRWLNFMRYHSRSIANAENAKPSRLCYADKLAFAITPEWLYLPYAGASGELMEYMIAAQQCDGVWTPVYEATDWYRRTQQANRNWVERQLKVDSL